MGYIEPIPEDESPSTDNEFVNDIIGNAIPPEYIQACEKGMVEAGQKGWLVGHPIQRMRVVLQDGQAHAVDSSELAFRTAMIQAIRAAFANANPSVLEPIMAVETDVPNEFQGGIIGEINRRRGLIESSTSGSTQTVIQSKVPLQNMFGFSTNLRSSTQGKGEFSMEYKQHDYVARDIQAELIAAYQKTMNSKK